MATHGALKLSRPPQHLIQPPINKENYVYDNAAAKDQKAVSIARHGGLKSLIDINLEAIDARQVNSLKLYTDSD